MSKEKLMAAIQDFFEDQSKSLEETTAGLKEAQAYIDELLAALDDN